MTAAFKRRLPGLLLLIVGAALLLHTFDSQYAETLMGLQHGPVFYPRILLVLWLVTAASSLVLPAVEPEETEAHKHRIVFGLAAVLLAYLLSLDLVGFVPATFVFCLVSQYVMRYRAVAWLVASAAIIAVGGWLLFEYVIGIALPTASLF